MLLVLSQLDFRPLAEFTRNQRGLALALVLGLALQTSEWRTRIIPPRGMPHWRDEVAAFRQNPNHRLGIWPMGWSFLVPRGTR